MRAWFKRIDHDQNVAAGRALFERELKRLALAAPDIDRVPAQLHLQTLEEVYVGLALGAVSAIQLARAGPRALRTRLKRRIVRSDPNTQMRTAATRETGS